VFKSLFDNRLWNTEEASKKTKLKTICKTCLLCLRNALGSGSARLGFRLVFVYVIHTIMNIAKHFHSQWLVNPQHRRWSDHQRQKAINIIWRSRWVKENKGSINASFDILLTQDLLHCCVAISSQNNIIHGLCIYWKQTFVVQHSIGRGKTIVQIYFIRWYIAVFSNTFSRFSSIYWIVDCDREIQSKISQMHDHRKICSLLYVRL